MCVCLCGVCLVWQKFENFSLQFAIGLSRNSISQSMGTTATVKLDQVERERERESLD